MIGFNGEAIEFPSRAMRETTYLHINDLWLKGFLISKGFISGFILSDGRRTECKGIGPELIMPESIKQTTRIEIYYRDCLSGFNFFDCKNTLIFQVGSFDGHSTTVEIRKDEQIIGVKTKIADTSLYDF